jgi:PAS domain S-box-containing protein
MPYRTRIGQVVCAASARSGLYATFEQSSDPMMLVCPEDATIVDANEAYLDLVGQARDEVIGRPHYEHAVGGSRPPSLENYREWTRAMQRAPDLVVSSRREMVCSDGSTTLVQWSFTSETVTGQNLLLAVGVPVGQEADSSPLTARELEVVRLLALGRRGADIAAELFISPDTVETHTRNARLKLGAATLAELVAKALSGGVI